MRGMLRAGVIVLTCWTAGVRADDAWWRAGAVPSDKEQPASSSTPLVTLGSPVALADDSAAQPAAMPSADPALTNAGYNPPSAMPPIVQTQATGLPAPTLSPLPPPPGGIEPYNCGVANQPADAGTGFWGKCKDFCSGFPWFGKGAFDSTNTHHLFMSDHEFDGFISPVSNPFYFEDPRSLTELRPIFIYEQAGAKNPIFRGGDIEYFGLQGRLALSPCWSLVVTKLGITWIEPHEGTPVFQPHDGFSEIIFGPKWTFLRSEGTKTLGAVGLNFDFPAGDHKVLQDTGSLSLIPYLSMAQSFCGSTYGAFNAMGTLGYNLGVDDKRSDDLFLSLHLDYDIGNLHKFYPLIEMNFFYYTSNGKANALNFEGRDLFNFGSTGVSGHSEVSLAAGLRYKVNECIQLGFVGEVPLTTNRDLLAYRVTFDVIFRY
jgi:hypothetical protein